MLDLREVLGRVCHGVEEPDESWADLIPVDQEAWRQVGDRIVERLYETGFAVVYRAITPAVKAAGAENWCAHNHGEPYSREIEDIWDGMMTIAVQEARGPVKTNTEGDRR